MTKKWWDTQAQLQHNAIIRTANDRTMIHQEEVSGGAQTIATRTYQRNKLGACGRLVHRVGRRGWQRAPPPAGDTNLA
jgi:hypothetical protein